MRPRHHASQREPAGRAQRSGFTLLELLVVLLVISVTLAVAAQGYGLYLERTAARKAAELFARDLSFARTAALRDRQPVSLVVLEEQGFYVIRRATGEVIVRRDYGPGSEVRLTLLDLELEGDSVGFNGRGLADLSGATGALGRARFGTQRVEYRVRFNAMGASEVHRP
jgi:prepilin-type N-terminal cleavage/methylation domain-containing protein